MIESADFPRSISGAQAARLGALIDAHAARVGVIGLGYVGLPLAMATARAGFPTSGFDIDHEKVAALGQGQSYIDAVPATSLGEEIAAGRFGASADMRLLERCDVIVICVPTPLSRNREPNLAYVEATTRQIAETLRRGQLVVLESTTWPGTTEEVVIPILEETGLICGKDFFVGFSPEREDPGNASFHTRNIPKVVAGHGDDARQMVEAFYSAVVANTVAVSTTATAEAVKITENVFRAVNVALVNELKVIYEAMGIDIWEVIDAAATKPFGYMPFYPGPGLGGHCIPIDPFYLTWRAREFGIATRFIELAGEINHAMPGFVVARLEEALDRHCGKALSRARVLLVGMAYKKNVSDMRESPSLELMERVTRRGCSVDYHDPHVPEVPPTREYTVLAGRRSVSLDRLDDYDAVLIATDHDTIDYGAIADSARLVVDTRNAMERRGLVVRQLVKA
ncbi:MAG: nucleotide sugar dehydrogenase [Alphaproteobacteria bacterium]|nr:MAG: nucleotide sugar dehydrogenase [Alphaproteobacteria bacterium]